MLYNLFKVLIMEIGNEKRINDREFLLVCIIYLISVGWLNWDCIRGVLWWVFFFNV